MGWKNKQNETLKQNHDVSAPEASNARVYCSDLNNYLYNQRVNLLSYQVYWRGGGGESRQWNNACVFKKTTKKGTHSLTPGHGMFNLIYVTYICET